MNEHTVVICTENTGYEASLELRKLYEALPDADASMHNQTRVIDESGEDYLYPMSFFTRVNLPQDILRQLFDAA
jgi:hypothetical protein